VIVCDTGRWSLPPTATTTDLVRTSSPACVSHDGRSSTRHRSSPKWVTCSAGRAAQVSRPACFARVVDLTYDDYGRMPEPSSWKPTATSSRHDQRGGHRRSRTPPDHRGRHPDYRLSAPFDCATETRLPSLPRDISSWTEISTPRQKRSSPGHSSWSRLVSLVRTRRDSAPNLLICRSKFTSAEQERWQHVTAYRRVRGDLQPADLERAMRGNAR
jgi:hypothetical protein